MICILHGYLLEGSGSNLWTRSIVEALCREGQTVHLMAQENHPERYPFIREARSYRPDGTVETFYERDVEGGCCILHKPELGNLLPVYVRDRYEEFDEVVPMVELSDAQIEDYLERNRRALRRIVKDNDIDVVHANHAVLMPVVAQTIHEELGTPYVVMPHGSAIEYAVRPDARMRAFAAEAVEHASRLLVIGEEMRRRTRDVLGSVPGLDGKIVELHLGVDTSRFKPVDRSDRAASIRALKRDLEGLDRGKEPEQTERLIDVVEDDPSMSELRETIEETTEYELKEPDADLESKLDRVDWERDRTLLYVGRLIDNKGPQNILAALPLVMQREPDLRFVLVGHGPLREVMEALVEALSEGNANLVREILESGKILESEDASGGGFREWLHLLDMLDQQGKAHDYFESAARSISRERVIFTGYLTHRELRHLFPCFDVAVFPSLIKEAGPLVFLEALASGIFPMGTYFGGMKASIDALDQDLPGEVLDLMKVDPAPERLIVDLAAKLPDALRQGDRWRDAMRQAAVERFDWRAVASRLGRTLAEVSAG